MPGGLGHEGFVEHEVGFLQRLFDVAERPLVGGPCRAASGPSAAFLKSSSVHFQTAICGGGGPAGAPPRPPRPSPRPCGAAPGAAGVAPCGAAAPAAGVAGGGWCCGAGTHPHIPLGPRVGAAGPQALDRIDHERQRLELDLDRFDRFDGFALARSPRRRGSVRPDTAVRW